MGLTNQGTVVWPPPHCVLSLWLCPEESFHPHLSGLGLLHAAAESEQMYTKHKYVETDENKSIRLSLLKKKKCSGERYKAGNTSQRKPIGLTAHAS